MIYRFSYWKTNNLDANLFLNCDRDRTFAALEMPYY